MTASFVVCSCGFVIVLWGGGVVSSASCGFIVLVVSSGQMLSSSGEFVPDGASVLASSWGTSPGPVVAAVVALSISFSMCPSLFRSARACKVEVSRNDRLAGTMFLTGSNFYSCIFSLFSALSGSNIQSTSSQCSKYVSQADPASVSA